MHTIDAELAGTRHTIDAELGGARHKRQTGGATGRPKKRNSNIVLNDKGHAPVNKLNSSEVIRLTVVITDKKKNKAQQQGIVIREVAAPSFQACTLSFEFWILIIGMTVVVVALTATTVSCALKRRKLKNRKKRHNDKAVKMALNNMKRMQMSSLPWNFYNR
ncbi:hypothetical protein V1264_007988 [Littorina saxatilis]|uniref:Uncharacterized protein n=2 Tax=Littorina saxatilis TaxID=31220 RepID=A0AAN9ATD2_9CAEN